MSRVKNTIARSLALSIGTLAVWSHTAHAQILRGNLATKVSSETGLGLGERSPIETAGYLIALFLGLLGLIAIAIIIKAGFEWMTAQGNTDKVDKAKKELQWATIGLLVILASYSLATFIFEYIERATGQGSIGG